ncbi:hypothetical protein [Roseococcus sp. YIM B11640]|uniref:hypothetical protein n=1 Tax=Roseococcus sp. YIM B11640 TaxID=3133973 RepID=UPI003C7D7A4E
MNARSPICELNLAASTIDLTALAAEAQCIVKEVGNRSPCGMTPDRRTQDDRALQTSYALEDVVLAGEPTKVSDCLAQLVLLVNQIRMASEDADPKTPARLATIGGQLERTTVALALLLSVNIVPLGAWSYFYPDALLALGLNTKKESTP